MQLIRFSKFLQSNQFLKNKSFQLQANLKFAISTKSKLQSSQIIQKRSLNTQIAHQFALETQEKIIKNIDILNVLNTSDNTKFRNVAIIAHVDHGKTTLVDTLLKHSGLDGQQSMDSNALEQEKGITILSKVTGITFKDYKINIVDTPGHQDFGGEVERIMQMVDGVILLICATEGPMTQTKFVLRKALKQGLKPIVIINKVDRPSARCKEVESEILDLFIEMEIPEEDLDYPIYYASGREGWAVEKFDQISGANKKDFQCVLEAIVKNVPCPKQSKEGDFQMLISQTESNIYHGKMVIGKIQSGILNIGDKLQSFDCLGNSIEHSKVMKIVRRYGMKQMEIQTAYAGDIVSVAGFVNSTVTYTLNKFGNTGVISSVPIDPPIMGVSISPNTSPLAGKEGTKLTYSQLRQRLQEESENDVALRIQGVDKKEGTSLVVEGRGDLHLGILFENMRREGFEMSLTPPQILFKQQGNKTLEPIEKVKIELNPIYSALIIEKMGNRKGVYENCEELSFDLHRLTFSAPTRGLIGFRSEILNDTKGTAILESTFSEYQEHKGQLKKNTKGALICTADGQCTAYAIKSIEKFGNLFIQPGTQVYQGMIIGENQKESDVDLNPTKKKELNNIRTKAHEEKVVLQPHKTFNIEEAISYIRDDEIVEVTPKSLRIRKKDLDPNARAKFNRDAKSRKQI